MEKIKTSFNVLLTFISLSLGLYSVHLEFRLIKPNLFLEEVITAAIFSLFIIILLIHLFLNIKKFKEQKRVSNLWPSFVMTLLLAMILIHKYLFSESGFGETKFIAVSNLPNHGVVLDFKTNNNLRITQLFKFGEINYWGKYEMYGDTIRFDIKTDFGLKDIGLIRNDTIFFISDSSYYVIEH